MKQKDFMVKKQKNNMLQKIKTFVTNKEEYYPNIEIFCYHILKAIRKTLIKMGLKRHNKHNKDMFDWSLYHLHYKGELKQNAKKYSLTLQPEDYIMEQKKLVLKNQSIKPLHHSPKFLYETIIQLNPKSIFEIGCGTGVNLQCMKTLLPKSLICGIDLLPKQIKTLKHNFPELINMVKQTDATIPFTVRPFEKCELAFTQAVIMHIHTDNLYLTALENLFAMSSKYVILMEGIRSRNYKEDIQKLFDNGKIKWSNIFFYYRINEEIGRPNGIICSTVPLPYPELKDYSIFHDKK